MSEVIEPVNKTPSLIQNYVSLFGAAVVLACLVSIVLLLMIEVTSSRNTPYLGIFAWIILPAILILGLIVIGVGMLIERRRRRKLSPSELSPFPNLNLNDPRGRHSFRL